MQTKFESTAPALTVIGIDIGKDVFHVLALMPTARSPFGADQASGTDRHVQKAAAVRRRHGGVPERPLRRRTLRQLRHEPRIIPAIYVKPFAKGQKNDYNDAEAIAEAALRPNLRTVQEKTQDQLDLQACHRVRSRLVSRRTATINRIRAFLIATGQCGASGFPGNAQLAVRNSGEPC